MQKEKKRSAASWIAEFAGPKKSYYIGSVAFAFAELFCGLAPYFIMELPQGYETVVGEGGASLSGGERQRISIARAIMKDAPVIILDEATANVDPENERDLIRAIDALTKEKTIIMIAHRLITVMNANQILVVDKGKIVQRGRHQQLMAEEGIYKRFVESRKEAVSWKL